MSNLIYNINEKPKTIKEWIFYSFQQVFSVFVATVLIANICGTPVSSGLLGACIGTLVYQLITRFRSPMFISNCGATVSAVIGALAIGGGNNYLAVAIGGLVIFLIYALFAAITYFYGSGALHAIFPPTIVGPITIVIGLNLAKFIPTYTSVNGEHSNIGILVALFTTLIIAISSYYFKGFLRTIPFLIGLVGGYLLSLIFTLTNVAPLVDLSLFNIKTFFSLPDLAFLHWDFSQLNWSTIGQVVLMFTPVAICALLEHFSDHRVLSNIIGHDLITNPGLHKTLLGDGCASFMGTIICGLPNTSYGESIATVGFSRVASVSVITTAACMLGAMSFITPIQVLIMSIPSCVFGGCAIILYGYIAASGLRTLFNSDISLDNNKNLIIISTILTIGVSGIWLFHESFAAVALAMTVGVILNLVLNKSKKI